MPTWLVRFLKAKTVGIRGGFSIYSVVDSATQYLWLLPIRHKTAECVAATLFDEVISRVSVPSSIVNIPSCLLEISQLGKGKWRYPINTCQTFSPRAGVNH